MSNYEDIEINVSTSARNAALQALAFFQMGQLEKVTVEIDDDQIKVHLDNEWLSWPFDDTVNEKSVWTGLYGNEGCELDTNSHCMNEGLYEAIVTEIAELAGFAYHAASAAIDTLNNKEG